MMQVAAAVVQRQGQTRQIQLRLDLSIVIGRGWENPVELGTHPAAVLLIA